LFREAGELVALLPELLEKDEMLDIMAGSAGAIASILSLCAIAPSASTLAVAVQCGDPLLARAQPMQTGLGWKPRGQETVPIGFPHGAAGIAWSLLKLAHVSGEERFRLAAIEALQYERSLFSPGQPQGLYLPGPGDEQARLPTWCHGAPGIGLAHLDSLKELDDEQIREEIHITLKTTIAEGFGLNHSLCHGDFGNAEALLVASQTLHDLYYREQTERIIAMLLDSIDTHGWVTGVPLGVETPGLMTGLAGIGYQLLRLAEPEKVPSVLLVAPPYARNADNAC
jgi:lantibiotic modifying enzyme